MITAGKNQHKFDFRDKLIRLQGGEFHRVRIGRDCWIGNGAIIMADVGEGSVIAAGSVVTKPIPPYSIAVGSPARVIGERGCGPA
jgi:acetyltransferase-like isoleucine patch superfamily enzyme